LLGSRPKQRRPQLRRQERRPRGTGSRGGACVPPRGRALPRRRRRPPASPRRTRRGPTKRPAPPQPAGAVEPPATTRAKHKPPRCPRPSTKTATERRPELSRPSRSELGRPRGPLARRRRPAGPRCRSAAGPCRATLPLGGRADAGAEGGRFDAPRDGAASPSPREVASRSRSPRAGSPRNPSPPPRLVGRQDDDPVRWNSLRALPFFFACLKTTPTCRTATPLSLALPNMRSEGKRESQSEACWIWVPVRHACGLK
jgi:hypothetical protein